MLVILSSAYAYGMRSEYAEGKPATTHQTVDAIAKSTARTAFPLRWTFLQQKGQEQSPPLATFVTAGDRTALLLYFLALTKASKEPWDVSLHSGVWARALGFPAPNSPGSRSRLSKTWSRLVDRRLVARTRHNRLARYTLLSEDGSGLPYDRPKSLFLNVPHELWIDGPQGSDRWFELLSLPELAFLVIALSNADYFPLPAERGPDYYHISADTLQRGVRGLREHGLLLVERHRITAPLAPEGVTVENRYTLQPPFGPQGTRSTATSRAR